MINFRHDVYVHFPSQPETTATTLARILKLQETIMTTQAETLAILANVKAKLNEASAELTAKIAELTSALAAAGHNSPEVDLMLAEVQAISDALAAVIPNPEPQPAP